MSLIHYNVCYKNAKFLFCSKIAPFLRHCHIAIYRRVLILAETRVQSLMYMLRGGSKKRKGGGAD